MATTDPRPASNDDLNPHREADRERASSVVEGQLRQKGVTLSGSESSDELADLLSAVEMFESTVSVLGGDNMVNRPQSTQPEDEAFVLPKRRGDEGAASYAERITRAADQLARHHRPVT